MASRRIMVALSEEVHGQLVEMRDSLIRAYVAHQVDLDFDPADLSLSQMVGRLIRHVQNDRRRMREAKARRADRMAGRSGK